MNKNAGGKGVLERVHKAMRALACSASVQVHDKETIISK
jgi:hypothetical protein